MVTGPVSFSGLVPGLNTQSIISAEMAVYKQPLTNLQTEQSTINTKISDYQTINSQLLALQQSGDALADPSAFNEAYAAASSNSSVATAVSPRAPRPGRSRSQSTNWPSDPRRSLRERWRPQRHRGLRPGHRRLGRWCDRDRLDRRRERARHREPHHHRDPVLLGRHGLGLTPVGTSTTIDASNDQLDVVVNGTAQTITLASGTYTPGQLAQAVDAASGGALTATVAGSGQLSLATAEQDLPPRSRSRADPPCRRSACQRGRRSSARTGS